MTSLTFKFNEDKVRESQKTVEEIMSPIRKQLLCNGAIEIEPFVFVADGINADTIFTSLIVKITKNDYTFINLLDKWIFDSNGEEEDCIEETKRWYERKGIKK